MVQRALWLLCVGCLMLMLASCGQTYELQSITVASSSSSNSTTNLEGIGATDSLVVTAHYSNTKTEVVTSTSKYQLGASANSNAPLTSLSVSQTGGLEVVNTACTWHATPTNAADTTFAYSTEPYTVTVTYQGFTTQEFVSVANSSSCYDGVTYKAPAGFTGNISKP